MLCPICHQPVDDSTVFCPICGSDIKHSHTGQQPLGPDDLMFPDYSEPSKASEESNGAQAPDRGNTAERFAASVVASDDIVGSFVPSWMGKFHKTVVVLSAVLLITMLLPWVNFSFLSDFISSNPTAANSLQVDYSIWQLTFFISPYALSQWSALGLSMLPLVLSLTVIIYFIALILLVGGFFFMLFSKNHSTVLIGVAFLLCAVVSISALAFMFYINNAPSFHVAGVSTIFAPTIWCILSVPTSVAGIAFSVLAKRTVFTTMK